MEQEIHEFILEKDIKEVIDHQRSKQKNFVGEFDGMRIIEDLLPVEEAIEAGAGTQKYEMINNVYKSLKQYVSDLGKEPMYSGQIATSTAKPSLDFYDNLRDRTQDNKLVPYQGSFSIFHEK